MRSGRNSTNDTRLCRRSAGKICAPASSRVKLDTAMAMRKQVYLSLGSNVGERGNNLLEAIGRLDAAGQVISVSSFYETEPVEVRNQPWFLNCAVALETTKMPKQLMALILRIERQMGRQRTQKKGPRKIDIDIVLCGNAIVNSAELTVPHPAMHERRFVLEPLAEVAPDVRHPNLTQQISELLNTLPAGPAVRKAED